MEKIAPSDIPQSVLDAINDDAEKLYPYRGNEAFGFQQTRRKAYITGRQEQLQKDLEFVEWVGKHYAKLAYYQDKKVDDLWFELSYPENKRTTIELYQEYIKTKEVK